MTGLAVAAGLPLLQHLKFDFNPLNLRSAKVELVATMLDLMKDPATSPDTIDILAPSLADASTLARRLDQLPEVARTATLESFVPDDQDKKLAIIADAASLLGPTLEPSETKPHPSDEETVQALTEASDAFVEARGQRRGGRSRLCAWRRRFRTSPSSRRAAGSRSGKTLLAGLDTHLQPDPQRAQARARLHRHAAAGSQARLGDRGRQGARRGGAQGRCQRQ